MLLPEQVKPLLLHEDSPVRDMAAEYFRQSWSQDVELVPLVYEACRRYGTTENLHLLAASRRFVLTDEAVPLILELLAKATDRDTAYHLNGMLVHAPVGVVLRNERAILDTPNLRADTVERINRRKDLAGWSGSQLWTELQAYAHRSADAKSVNKIDHGYANDLIDALETCEEPTTATICEQLGSYGPENGDWLETFLIDLAGARRLREAIPYLVEKLRIDADYLLEQSMYALARIGDVEAVRLIQSAWPAESWNFKNYAHNVLGSIKQSESEEAILALLETETDIGFRTCLCQELCELISERGVEVVRKQIRDGYDRLGFNLEGQLLPVAHVLGIALPEADEWRLEREERNRSRDERMAELNELARRYQLAQERKPPVERKIQADGTGDVLTIRNEHERVGRNDPCPCGSGKKFKKCCGRS
jgi:hypothetical protein